MSTVLDRTPTNETAIFSRMLDASQKRMSPSAAQFVLSLAFSNEDRERMQDLADRNQAGELDRDEKQELNNYVRTGHLLALMQSRARRALKKR